MPSYTGGTIYIPNVTGNIVITAVATAATVTSISAVFNQGQNVIYDTDSLDTLKQYLTVTATYTGGATAVVTGYTLSGTLTVGTSTITVSYSGKTTTFNVSVTHESYEFENGTHTFSANQRVLTISNGCHFLYEAPNASTTSSGAYLNLSTVSENDSSAVSANNVNKTVPLFTIPSGANVIFEVKNISFTNVATASTGNEKYALALRNGTTSVMSTGDKGVTDTADISISQTINSDTPITCVFMYASSKFSAFEADINLTVNGARWI